jgi:hypothetical protein
VFAQDIDGSDKTNRKENGRWNASPETAWTKNMPKEEMF